MVSEVKPASISVEALRSNVKAKYTEVALDPGKGFHFHTGRRLARMLGYTDEDMAGLPEPTIESFAGTGNPFVFGKLNPGETVVDIGCGAGFDTLQAARQVGPRGTVIAVDMTPAMLEKARVSAHEMHLSNVDFRIGYAEKLPVEDGTADVVISNGVINLTPDKQGVLRELYRILKPGGRMQVADILVHRAVPQDAKDDIDLWSG